MNWLGELVQKEVVPEDSVLSLGCGIMEDVEGLVCSRFIGVDIYRPYIDLLKKKLPRYDWILADLRNYQLKENCCDVILALDVLEHLEYGEALNLLKRMQTAARKKVVIYTPAEFHDNVTEDGKGEKKDVFKWLNEEQISPYRGLGVNPHQAHRCVLTEEELQDLGFVTSTENVDGNIFGIWTKPEATSRSVRSQQKKGNRKSKTKKAGSPAQKKPFFTVVIPTYNQAQYLGPALESLFAQSFSDWEAVVVNDGSTDNTAEVMEEYAAKDQRIRLFHKENGGVASALNVGIREARGEWICWLSSDDLFEPDKLEVHFRAIQENPEIKFFHSHWYLLLEENGQKIAPGLWLDIPPDEFQVSRFLLANYVHGNAIAVHRTVFDEVGLFDERFRQGQDYDMWLRISARFVSKYIDRRTCVTRIHPGQTTNSFYEGGVLDSTRSAIGFLNRHRFEEIFPLLNLHREEDAKKALIEAIEISSQPEAFMYRAAFIPALIDRAVEWLSNRCPKKFLPKLSYLTDSLLKNLQSLGLPPEIERCLNRLKLKQNFVYQRYSFLNEMLKYTDELIEAGFQKKALDLERYTQRIWTQVAELSDEIKPFIPKLLGHPREPAFTDLAHRDIREWEIVPLSRDLETVQHRLLLHCPACDTDFRFVAEFEFARDSQQTTLICPNCKKGYRFSDRDIDRYFLEKNEGVADIENTGKTAEPRVAFVIRDADVLGGGTRIAFRQVDWLVQLGCRVTVFSNSQAPSWRKLSGAFQQVADYREIPPAQFDLVVVHTIFDIPKLMLNFPIQRIVLLCQGYEGYHYGRGFAEMRSDKYLFDKLHALPFKTIVVSEHLRDLFQKKFHRKSFYIPNSIDHTVFRPDFHRSKTEHSIVFIGNPFHQLKGFNMLGKTINVIQSSQYAMEDLTLYLVSNLSGVTEELVREKISDRLQCKLDVRQNLSRKAVADLLRKAGVVVCSSWYEGFSLPVLEAMACGTPVITTNNMGAESFVKDGQNGAVVTYGNVREFGEKIIDALINPQKYRNQVLNAAETALEFNLQNSFRHFTEAYQALLGTSFDENRLKQTGKQFVRLTGEMDKIKAEIQKRRKAVSANQSTKRTPLVSIVILTFNQLSYTRKCLESIEKYTRDVKHEVILVDNASKDGTVPFLKKWVKKHPHSRLIVNSENRGYAGGNNQGIKAAHGDYVLLLNNDVEVTPGWLSRMVRVMEQFPELGIVGPMTNYIAGPQKDETSTYTTNEGLLEHARIRAEKYSGKAREAAKIVGFAMLVKKTVFESIGVLDERFGRGNYEDDDFCLRASLKGFKLAIVLDSFIHHYGSKSFHGNNIDYEQSLKENNRVFLEKWKEIQPAHPIYLTHLLERSRFDEEEGNFSAALESIRQAFVLAPGEREIHWRYLELLELTGDEEAYARLLIDYVQKYPKDADGLNKLGVFRWTKQQFREATELFEQAAANNGSHIEHLKNLADAYLVLEKFDRAVQLLIFIMQKFPDDFEAYEKMANLYVENGDYQSAVELVQKYLETHPEDEYAASMSALLKVPELYIAFKLINQGEFDTAAGLLEKYLEKNPRDEVARLGLGSILFNQGKFEQAESLCRQVLQDSPRQEEAVFYLAKIFLITQKSDAFGQLLAENEPLFQNSLLLRKVHIEYLLALEKEREALKNAETLVKKFPRDAEAHVLTGTLKFKTGAAAAARHHFQEALKIDPTNELARENLLAIAM